MNFLKSGNNKIER